MSAAAAKIVNEDNHKIAMFLKLNNSFNLISLFLQQIADHIKISTSIDIKIAIIENTIAAPSKLSTEMMIK